MKYISVSEMTKKWNISERSVRNYCANNRVEVHSCRIRHGLYQIMRKSQNV